ncbi:MAG: hypothetical protein BroJett018_20630 [Chloroflexota bacterium]|nr:MAG: hypothetical protein BroJett018_20630 [Chloroflexota bacterium]
MPEIVIKNGLININGVNVPIPNIEIKAEISRGASGIVFEGLNPYLDRTVAVKIWMTLRNKDRRDKFEQGIQEARKAANHSGIEIYDAGNANGFFYMVMHYLKGWHTLDSWLLNEKPRFATRYQLANRMWRELGMLHSQNVLHGDLHLKNILVSGSPPYGEKQIRKFAPSFVFIDFGTSYFSDKGFSKKRHWRVIETTLDTLLHPFKINDLWKNEYSPTEDNEELDDWFGSYLANLVNMLWYIGFHPSVTLFVPDMAKIKNSLPLATRQRLDDMLQQQIIDLSDEVLGYPREWEELGSPW